MFPLRSLATLRRGRDSFRNVVECIYAVFGVSMLEIYHAGRSLLITFRLHVKVLVAASSAFCYKRFISSEVIFGRSIGAPLSVWNE